MKGIKRPAGRRACYKLNNHGSTLLTVIVCIAFIAILGSLMLSVTMTNLRMKLIESRSKKNFYSCETVMEKIRVAVQDVAAEAVKEVYEKDVLTNYASYLRKDEAARNAEIMERVIAEFMVLLDVVADPSLNYADIIHQASSEGYEIDSEENYFKANNYLTDTENNAISWSLIKCERKSDTDPYSTIRIKDIKIEYVQGNYRTAIASDIIVTMPEFSFTQGTWDVHYRMDQPYKQYVLMADGNIVSDNIGGMTAIRGNVYSGAGILIDGQNSGGHTVNINSNIVATGGDVTVSDTAALQIGEPGGKSVLWADNLATSTSDAYSSDSGLETGLTVNGISLVRDDLTVDGRNSKVILNGAYVGYTGAHTAEGSSMIINGSSSKLDLSGLEELILAGRANVSVQDIALNKDTDILTGESIAVKSNQRAYLLPAKFITNIRHNPVTPADYSGGLMPVIDIDDMDEAIKYNKYIYPAVPYKIAAKQTGATVLRYYYLNFLRGWKADAYFAEFFHQRPDALNLMEPFSIDALLLPEDGEIHTAGNITGYDAHDGGLSLAPGMSSLPEYAGDIDAVYDAETEASFDNELDVAIAGIILDNAVYEATMADGKAVGSLNSIFYDAFDTVASTINPGGVSSVIDNSLNNGLGLSSELFNDYYPYAGNADYKNSDPSKRSFWVIDGDVTVSRPDDPAQKPVFNGIMIATGDITVCDNAEINGILISTGENGSAKITVGNNVSLNGRIITTGDIRLGQGCDLIADGATDTAFDDNIFLPEAEILKYLFKNVKLTVDFTIENPAAGYVDLSGMISYENWRRTE